MSIIVPMALQVFPGCPGYGFTAQPGYLVNLVCREGGYERSDRRWARPQITFSAVPLGPRDEDEIQSVLYFWHAMGGRATEFLVKDWTDYKSCPTWGTPAPTDQPLVAVALEGGGTGYQLVKEYRVGALVQRREITKPVGSTIHVANFGGSAQSHWTLDEDTGLVKPGAGFSGTPTSWGGEFLVPVRFDSELDAQIVDKQVQSVSFTLKEKRVALTNVFVEGSGDDGGSPGAGSPGGSPGGGSPGGGSPGGGSPGGGSPGGPMWTPGTPSADAVAIIDSSTSTGTFMGASRFGDLFRSTDDGESWSHIVLSGSPSIVAVRFGNGTFIAVSDAGNSYRSTDDGVTWSSAVSIGTTLSGCAVGNDGGNNWVIVGLDAGFTNGFKSRSTDNGATWSESSSVFYHSGGHQHVVWDSNNSVFVVAGVNASTFDNAVYSSADGGATWTAHLLSVFSILTLSWDGTHFILGTQTSPDTSVCKVRIATTAAGLATAADIDPGLSSAQPANTVTIAVFALPGGGLYFAFGDQGGVASSTDGGATWEIGDMHLTGSSWPRAEQQSIGYDPITRTVIVMGISNKSDYVAP